MLFVYVSILNDERHRRDIKGARIEPSDGLRLAGSLRCNPRQQLAVEAAAEPARHDLISDHVLSNRTGSSVLDSTQIWSTILALLLPLRKSLGEL